MDQQYVRDALNFQNNEFEPQKDLTEQEKKLKDHMMKKEYQFVDSDGKVKYMFDPTESMGVVPFRQRTDHHNIFAQYQAINGTHQGAILTPEDEQKRFDKFEAMMKQVDSKVAEELQQQLEEIEQEETENALQWDDV